MAARQSKGKPDYDNLSPGETLAVVTSELALAMKYLAAVLAIERSINARRVARRLRRASNRLKGDKQIASVILRNLSIGAGYGIKRWPTRNRAQEVVIPDEEADT